MSETKTKESESLVFMDSLSNVLVTLCGLGVVCCGALGVALFLLFRVTGRSFLLPAFSAISNVFSLDSLGFGGDDDDTNNNDDDGVGEYRSRRTRSPEDSIRARIQSADDDFNARLRSKQSGGAPRDFKHSSGTPPDELDNPDSQLDTYRRARGRDLPTVGSSRFGSDDDSNDESGRFSRGSRSRRRDRDYGDEVFGGGLDNDADGTPDIFE